MRYFTNVHDLGDLKTALAEAFEIKKDRYKYENLGKHKTCLLIFFNNSLRTRLSTQKAARNLLTEMEDSLLAAGSGPKRKKPSFFRRLFGLR